MLRKTQGNRSPSIKEIAEEIGVHPSTVSRALDPRKRHLVGDEVAQRIISRSQSLGYRPNHLAAGLRRGRTQLIGILLPDITNPVFAPILAGIAEVLSKEGLAPIVADAGNDASQQIAFVDRLLNQRVDGLILATVSRDDALVGHCLERGLPVVLVNRSEASDRVPSVVSDDAKGMALAVDHLVSNGHRAIAHIAGPLDTSTGLLRRDGFVQAMAQHGLTGAIEQAALYSREAGEAAAHALLGSHHVSAIVAANDLLALGVLIALRQLGQNCPEGISVIGHNDMPLMDVVSPPLTTIRIEHRDMGRNAARLLLDALEQRDTTPRHIVLPPKLVVRGSTAPMVG
ncbi:LacI family transcriptional regulator [Bradyrhizobium sp. AZCC 2262]|uniref:LacI family DNA-binding transcriptional regulator n=1 Tax=Bradyrhizobium sp. AZCC 2262 TaxID=3117022 RepID=UPI002FF2D8D0